MINTKISQMIKVSIVIHPVLRLIFPMTDMINDNKE